MEILRMNKTKQLILVVGIGTIILLPGCKTTTLNNDLTKQLESNIKVTDQSVEGVDVDFIRPNIIIHIYTKEKPSDEMIESMLDAVKQFSTVDNMDSICSQFDFGHALVVYLVFSKNGQGTVYCQYQSMYYKSANADDSPSNVDAYVTWTKVDPGS
jgi:hypothetical protein